MDLNTILEYQKVDMELYALENKLRQSNSKKSLDNAKDSGNRAMEDMRIASKKAEDIMFKLNRYNKDIEALLNEVNDIADTAKEFKELKELDHVEKKINQIFKQIEESERSANALIKDLLTIDKTKDDQIKQVKIAQMEFAKHKEKYESERMNLAKDAKPFMEKLKAMEVKIDPKLIEQYKTIRKNKMPVLIAANLEHRSCGCGIELDSNVISTLEKEGLAKCPNCSRIMYVKK